MSRMNDSHDCYKEDYYDKGSRGCKNTIKAPIGISTPVRVEPSVMHGRVNVHCGTPEIVRNSGKSRECNGGGGCEFVISQTICVEIPICYDVDTDIGASYIECGVAEV